MKRKDVSRFVALVLAASMAAGMLTGCGGAAEEEAAQEASKVTVNAEGLPIVNEPVTFTIAVPQTSELKAAAERECVKRTEEETGIHIEWVEIPKSGWAEKINILFSTDSLPDAICGGVDVSKIL